MCTVDSQTLDKMNQTAKQFLDEGRMFTGYDITLETRKRENIKLRHKDARGAIQDIEALSDALDFGHTDVNGEQTEWNKTLVPMSGGQSAFVYHPIGVDPHSYQAIPAQSHQPVQTATVDDDDDDDDNMSDSGGKNTDGTFATDYRNRLFVQTQFVRDVGLNKGDSAVVCFDSKNHRILVGSFGTFDTTNPDYVFLGSRVVERNGDLRLSSKNLRAAAFDVSGDFTIQNTDIDNKRVVEIYQ